MKTRIIFTTGFYNILTTVSTLKTIEKESSFLKYNNILVIIVINQDKNLLENFARSLFSFDEIILIAIKDINELFNKLFSQYLQIDELFIPYIGHYLAPLISFYTKTSAKINIVDEGAESYINNIENVEFFNNTTISASICSYFLYPNLLMEKYYGEVKQIDTEIFKSNLTIVSKFSSLNITEPFILFVSANYNDLLNKRNPSLLIDTINKLIEKYDADVYFQPHPREKLDFNNLFLNKIKNSQKFKILNF